MRRLFMSLTAVFACLAMAGCGSSGGGSTQKSPNVALTQAINQPEAEIDCDGYMQQLADNCFAVVAFEPDGVTPLHVKDDAGNDLGEVDQQWAANYCECYAQLAFQNFGCKTVLSHEEMDDDTYGRTYAPIVASCSSGNTN